MSRDIPKRSRAAWIAASVGLVATLYLFYPGFMTADSAEQWLQARTGRYTSVHPALMAMTWSWLEQVLPGPGLLFTLHQLLFWVALGWLARELFARPLPQIALVLVIGLWPPVTHAVAHIWKDGPMLAFVLLALAALARDLRRPARGWLMAAITFLAIACSYRHNAPPLAIPLLWYVVARFRPDLGKGRRVAGTMGLTVLVAILAALPNRLPQVEQRPVWPLTAIWDLAAVSVVRDEMLIPASWLHGELSLDELRQAFRPWSNTTIFNTGKILITLYVPPGARQMADLRRAWVDMIASHPALFVRHRLRLTSMLLGIAPDSGPPHFRFGPDFFQLVENPRLQRRQPAAQSAWTGLGHRLAATPVFSGWLYVGSGLVLLLACRWRRTVHPLLVPILLSAFVYLAPLPLVAPSSEFRYLLWPVVAVLLALFLFPTRRADDPARSTPA